MLALIHEMRQKKNRYLNIGKTNFLLVRGMSGSSFNLFIRIRNHLHYSLMLLCRQIRC